MTSSEGFIVCYYCFFIVIQTEGKLSAMDKEIKLCVQRDSTVSATTVCTCTYKFEQNME